MTELFDYQKQDVERLTSILKEHGRAACFSDVGTGKSIVSLFAAKNIGQLNTLIIVPAFLRYNWSNEIKKHLGEKSYVYSVKAKYNNEPYYIINYENLHKLKDLSMFDVVLCDESQYITNPKAIRTKLTYKIIKQIKYALLLSATPISRGIVQMFIYARILSPAFANISYWNFCMRYSNMSKKRLGGRVITEFTGVNAANIGEIRALQAKYTIRRKAIDVLSLPEMQEIEVMLNVENFAHDTEQVFKDFNEYMEYKKSSEHLLTYKRSNALCKAVATAKYLNAMSEPVVVFSDHPEALKKIKEGLELHAEIIDGSVPMERRQEIVDTFQGGNLNIILASIGALSEGVTLHKAAKVVYNDFPYSPVKLLQSQARIYRIGQTKNCQTIFTISSELDHRILEIIRRKQKDIQQITCN